MKKVILLSYFLVLLPLSVLGQDHWPEPQARLRTIVESTSMQFGETFSLTITLEVDQDNQAPIQFFEPGRYVAVMYKQLEALGLNYNFNLTEIYGQGTQNEAGNVATHYNLVKMLIEPQKTGTLQIPQFSMELLQYRRDNSDSAKELSQRESKLIMVQTKVKTIEVDPIKGFEVANSSWLIGTYDLDDQIKSGKYHVGDSIPYSLRFSGSGIGADLVLPSIKSSKFEVIVDKISYTDTVDTAENPSFTKQYDLLLVPLTKGKLKLSEHFQWDYLEPGTSAKKQLRAAAKLKIRKRKRFKPEKKALDIVLITDLSESMDIQDYAPKSRRTIAKELTQAYREFFGKQRIIGFAGTVQDLTDEITYELPDANWFKDKGTAIGDAVWIGTESLSATASNKVIIIIGDGDNTAGNVPPAIASQFAKEKGVRIFSIGLGHDGKVPFGKDFYGRETYVDNTFSAKNLKELASVTRGKYLYMDDYESPMQLMMEIKRLIEGK